MSLTGKGNTAPIQTANGPRYATRPGRGLPHAALWFACLIMSSIVASGAGFPPSAQSPGIGGKLPCSLTPGVESRVSMAAHGHTTCSFRLLRGEYAAVAVEQLDGLLRASPFEPDGRKRTPVTLDAGSTSIIRLPFVAARDGAYSVEISCRVPLRGACSAAVSISQPRSPSSADLNRARAERLLARAEHVRRKGERSAWPAAVRDYDQVIDIAKSLRDPEMLRAALTGKARILLYDLNDYEAAGAAAELAVEVSGASHDVAGQALAWKTLGAARYYLGDYPASIRDGRRALASYRATGDEYWQGIIQGNLAYKYKEIGDTDDGLASAGAALDIARRIGDGYGIDFSLETLAALHLERGDMEAAFNLYHQALDALQKQPYPDEAGAVWNGFGELYSQLGDTQRAGDSFERALEISIQAHDTAGELSVLSNLGKLALRQHDPATALSYFRRGIKTAESLSLPREQSYLLTGLGESYVMLHHPAQGLDAYHKAIAISRKISQRESEAEALQKLGDLDAELARSDAARRAYEESARLWREEDNRGRIAVTLASLARLDDQQGDLTSARERMEKALDLIESCRATLLSRDLRTSYFASNHDYYELAVNILMRLNRLHPGQGYDAQAFEMAERAKARTLLDRLEQDHAGPAAGLPPALVARQQRLSERVSAAYARLAAIDESGAERPGQRVQIRKTIEALLKKQDDVEARMRAASSQYAALARGRPVDVEDVEKQTGKRTALIEYWTGKHGGFLWIIDKGRLESFALPGERQLRAAVENYRKDLLARADFPPGEGFIQRHERVARADARLTKEELQLGRELLGPLSAFPGARRLLVVPDGPLWSLPFASLLIPESPRKEQPAEGEPEPVETGKSSRCHYALARFDMAKEPSASALLSLIQRRRKEQGPARVAIFADPVYSASDPRVEGHTALANLKFSRDSSLRSPAVRWVTEARMADLDRLAGSRREALQIASLAGPKNSKVYLGFAAQPAVVEDADWSHYRVVHFAAHAMVNNIHPEFSGIVLSMVGRSGAPEDGVLWLHNIYLLHMPVPLVVLSGCRTATGKDVPGEGIAGFARAFFFAGAQRVIGSLWSVEDEPTATLMQTFYLNLLKEKQPAAASLRAAQLAMARTPRTSAPYYWAGFILQGLAQ